MHRLRRLPAVPSSPPGRDPRLDCQTGVSVPVPPVNRSPSLAYDAILWDNDGVLVDTERWYYQATREAMAEAGIDLTPELFFAHFLANSNGAWHLAAARGWDETRIAALRQARNERYRRLLEREPIAIDGVRETLQALRPRFTMGIVTSSRRDHFETIHGRTGLRPFFDFVLTMEDYAESKPAPDPYLAAIARSGFPASRCLAIEDSPRGLVAARAAGLDCWVIRTELTRSADFSAAARILARTADVAPLLLGAAATA